MGGCDRFQHAISSLTVSNGGLLDQFKHERDGVHSVLIDPCGKTSKA